MLLYHTTELRQRTVLMVSLTGMVFEESDAANNQPLWLKVST